MSFIDVTLNLLNGFGTTCLLFALTLVMALPFGLIISFGSMSSFKPLKWLVRTLVWMIRGTPLMLQVIIVFYVPGLLFDMPMQSRITAVLIAFVINYAAYFSEIYRGGIESVNRGQYEAGQVLGMTKTQVFFKVVLLQIVKRILPAMSNEVITLVKDTSLARVILVSELIHVAQTYTAKGLIWPLFYSGVFYLIFCGILTLLFGFIEKKLSYFKG
ncbi:MAG: polar amino acid ABC transporter permease [Clostridiales bacterium]|nr:MAG: polar amino acid ABC transporter permease [Clostridiales bacterium]